MNRNKKKYISNLEIKDKWNCVLLNLRKHIPGRTKKKNTTSNKYELKITRTPCFS